MSTGHKTTLLLQGAALWSVLQNMAYNAPERAKAFAEFDAWAWHNPTLREGAKRLQFTTFDRVNGGDNESAPVRYVVVYGLGTPDERDETRPLESYAEAARIAGDRPRDHLGRVRIAQDTGTGVNVRRSFVFDPPAS